ncbi:MAG: hypothetical protein V4644_03205 [Patescibacteria group bacterium]
MKAVPYDTHLSHFEVRKTIDLPAQSSAHFYSDWLSRLEENRADIKVNESLTEHLDHAQRRANNLEPARLTLYDLLQDATEDHVADDLPLDEPVELWHVLTLLESQPWEAEGDLLQDKQNVFYLYGSAFLIIEGKPVRKCWEVSVFDFADHVGEFDRGTRFFRNNAA